MDLQSRESKEYDNDVNYDEAKIAHYDLPKLLVTPEGKKITSIKEWNEIRRPQILSLFSNLVYGRVPQPPQARRLRHRHRRRLPLLGHRPAPREEVEGQHSPGALNLCRVSWGLSTRRWR
mgnify:CR=1 FL=1